MPVVDVHIIVFFVVEGCAYRGIELFYLSALLFDVEMLFPDLAHSVLPEYNSKYYQIDVGAVLLMAVLVSKAFDIFDV